jgi:hypothetical protein
MENSRLLTPFFACGIESATVSALVFLPATRDT